MIPTTPKAALQELGTPPLKNPAFVVAATVGLTVIALAWGFSKGRSTRNELELKGHRVPRDMPLDTKNVFGAALEEEITFRAGLNRFSGPWVGSMMFGLVHLPPKKEAPAGARVLRVADAVLGGAMYSLAYATAAGAAPSGLPMIGAMARGLVASTAVHTAHNLGVRMGLRG